MRRSRDADGTAGVGHNGPSRQLVWLVDSGQTEANPRLGRLKQAAVEQLTDVNALVNFLGGKLARRQDLAEKQ